MTWDRTWGIGGQLPPPGPVDKRQERPLDLQAYMPELIALGQVLFIDIVLAGDNAIVVGMAVAGLPAEQKNKAIIIGIAAATVMRIGFALITVQLLAIVGLMLAGGLLLLWVCWKMYRDLRRPHGEHAEQAEAVEYPQPAPVRRDHQVLAAELRVAVRRRRQAAAERLPVVAVVERDEHPALRAGDEQPGARGVGADEAHEAAARLPRRAYADKRSRVNGWGLSSQRSPDACATGCRHR